MKHAQQQQQQQQQQSLSSASAIGISRKVPAFAMTAVAGWIDAAGLLLLFQDLRIFVTYMSGNTTRLFVSIVQEDWRRFALYGFAIALFVAGAALGRWINDGSRAREAAALLLESALLLAAALSAGRRMDQALTLGLLAFAMGWNNVALRSSNGVGPRGYVTGTLVSLASAIGDALARRGAWSRAIEPAAIWLSLGCGALAGAFATKLVPGAFVLLVPALVVALCGAGVAAGWVREE